MCSRKCVLGLNSPRAENLLSECALYANITKVDAWEGLRAQLWARPCLSIFDATQGAAGTAAGGTPRLEERPYQGRGRRNSA